jgi:hypothetical protein
LRERSRRRGADAARGYVAQIRERTCTRAGCIDRRRGTGHGGLPRQTPVCAAIYRSFPPLVALIATLVGSVCIAHAEEVAPFRFTGLDGYVTTRYLRDDFVTGQPGPLGGRTRQAQSDLRAEVFLMTHSYVYHPNLVSLDIGGGPILQRGVFDNNDAITDSRGMLYNLTGRATFLRDKPYRGSVFYDHLNPTLSIGPGQVLNQQNSRYGFDFSVLAPVTPLPMQVEATRSHFQGKSADRIIDDMIDRLNMRVSRQWGAIGSTQAQFQATHQDSMSGSPNLPIQTTTLNNQSLNVDTRFQMGANRQYDLINLITLNNQGYTFQQGALPNRRDARFLLDLRGRHSNNLQTFAVYNHSSMEQGDLSSIVDSGSGGVIYSPRPDVTATVAVRGDNSRNTQFTARTEGIDGSIRHQRRLPVGNLQVSYSVRYDNRDQQANAPQTNVIGERMTLPGTTVVALAHPRVFRNTLQVTNTARTQVFIEGLDYAVSVVGLETRLQRLVGGNIVDSQEVLVDYAYDVGGTYAYTQTDQTLNVNWEPVRFVNLYYRALKSDPHLTSGSPTFPLNKVQSNLYGARADVPLKAVVEVTVGGGFEYEDHHETIAPYTRQANDVYLQTEDPFFGRGNIRVSTHRTRVDYATSTQNIDLSGYDIRYWSRHPLGIELSADAGFERDTGALIPRTRLAGALRAQWRVRKFNVTAELSRTRETQGDFERKRTLGQVLLRRDL